MLDILRPRFQNPSMSLESPDAETGQRRRLLDDPRAIRALAHPTRLALLSIIGRSDRITAAAAARELGVSHALAVHHLRQLAKYGFVEQVEGADQREKPWRSVHTSLSLEGIEAKPGGADALAVFEQVGAETGLE
jgi:DNA-binding transcriptional ArsR family regulator